ncbi:MAG TPA: bifunctional UDP-N-acetylglucosamine diphosphorylase/glucosamine-1-phosphate N-acetyltransferase GlmU, partial [Candidatus Deferrimicrobiaceae bacterium]
AVTRKIREVNSGTYAFDRAFLEMGLPRLSDVNAQREFYLTDLVLEALAQGTCVVPLAAADPDEVRGINSRRELAEATGILLRKKLDELMASGVTVVDPSRTYVETGVSVGQDSVVEPGVFLLGKTRVGRWVRIQTGCVVEDCVLDDGAHLKPYCVMTSSRVRKRAIVGPFSHLRPEADIGEEAHIGNFVEVKKSRIGKGSKANHLAYLGDAVVGKKVNVGAGTITCNYDGIAKYQTVLGDGVFVGSDTMLVAPVTVGKGALIGAGSTITKNVPPYALALSRAEQKVSEFWVARKKPELLKKAGLAVPVVKMKEEK